MDSWKDHLKFGLLFEVIFIIVMLLWKRWFLILTPEFVFQFVIVIIISPIIPDLDHRQGKLREVLVGVGLLFGIIGVIGGYYYNQLQLLQVIGICLASFIYIISYVTPHRGFVHSLPVCVLYSVGVYLLTKQISLASLALLGSYTHLVADKIPFKLW